MKRIVIIGSGMGGASVALALVNKGFDVIVLEAGNEMPASDLGLSPVTEVGKPNTLNQFRAIQIGGTSNLWHGVVGLYDKRDFGCNEEKKWPIPYAELLPFWKAAFQFLTGQDPKDSFLFFDQVDDLFENKSFVTINKKYGAFKKFNVLIRPTRLIRKLQSSVRSGDLKIFKNHRAISLIYEEDSQEKVIGVKCHDGINFVEIKGDIFVVSAGAVESPCILLRSKFTNPGDVHNPFGNIGSWLSDHPMGFLAKIKFKYKVFGHRLSDIKKNKFLKERYGIIENNNNGLNINIYLRPASKNKIDSNVNKSMISFLGINGIKDINIRQLFALIQSPENIYRIINYFLPINFKRKYWELFMVSEQTPIKSSSVKLGPVDRLGIESSVIDWNISENDIGYIKNFISDLVKNKIFNEDYLISDILSAEDWVNHSSSAAHMMGTMRMGLDPKLSVVDLNLKLHSINNLYVCDASVLPCVGNVNPSLTICALSHRLSSHLLKLL